MSEPTKQPITGGQYIRNPDTDELTKVSGPEEPAVETPAPTETETPSADEQAERGKKGRTNG